MTLLRTPKINCCFAMSFNVLKFIDISFRTKYAKIHCKLFELFDINLIPLIKFNPIFLVGQNW